MPEKKKPDRGGGRHFSTTGTPNVDPSTVFNADENIFNTDAVPDSPSVDPPEGPPPEAPPPDLMETTQAEPDGDVQFATPTGATDIAVTIGDPPAPGMDAPEAIVHLASGGSAPATEQRAPASDPPSPSSSDPPFDPFPDEPLGDLPPASPSGVSVSSSLAATSPAVSESAPPSDLSLPDSLLDDVPGAPAAAREEDPVKWLVRHWIPATVIAVLIAIAIAGVVLATGGNSNSPTTDRPSAGASSSQNPSAANTPGGQGSSTPTGSSSATPGATGGLPSTGGSASGAPASPVAAHITTQPQSKTCTVGESVSMTVGASGVPAPTYTWQESANHGATWDLISGATAPSWSFQCTTQMNGWEYRVIVANSLGTVTSNTAGLGVG